MNTKTGVVVIVAVLLLGLFTVFRGCSPSPSISDEFRLQARLMLQKGANLVTATRQSVSYSDYKNILSGARNAYDLTLALWPSGDFAPEARQGLNKAFQGWELSNYLWTLKVNKSDNPTEPNINRYKEFIDYASPRSLQGRRWASDFVVEKYRNKQYLTFDENLPIFLRIANEYFEDARALLLKALD